MNKKGLSPLIATVLLIAFAVALGAVVMNWSKTKLTPEELQPLPDAGTGNLCKDVLLDIEKINGVPKICISKQNTLEFLIENKGSIPIKMIKMTIIGTSGDPHNGDASNSDIPPASTKNIEYEYPPSISSIAKVKITPVIRGDDRDEFCTAQSIEASEIGNC